MASIQCSIKNCSYNANNKCTLKTVKIGGISSLHECQTCCGSFLNNNCYSNLSNYTGSDCHDHEILCSVGTCAHNCSEKCTKDMIEITGLPDASIYTETLCYSFDNK